MRRIIIAGNWKLNKTIEESVLLAKEIKQKSQSVKDLDIMIAPVFTALCPVAQELKGSNVALGAQDLFWEESGAFTGEVSATLIKDAGCTYVIIGHSERRQYFHETNETVNKKVKAALMQGLIPIVCVGENLQERETGKTFAVVEDHVRNSLKDFNSDEMKKIIIAYEPVWAIGTGKTATPQQAQEVHAFIRGLLKQMHSDDVSESVRIQYGGSVKPDNAKELMGQKDIDGALVGGASLKADSFMGIIEGCIG